MFYGSFTYISNCIASGMLYCTLCSCACMGILDDFTAVQPKNSCFPLIISCRDRSQCPSIMKETAPDGSDISSRELEGLVVIIIIILVKRLPYLFRGTLCNVPVAHVLP